MNEKRPLAVVTQKSDIVSAETAKFNPDDIFRRIDQLRQNFEPEPSLLAQLLSPSARRHAEAINNAVISAIKARQTLIDGLAGCVRTYVDVHRGDLKIRGAGFILETLARQTRGLTVMIEEAYVGFLETYSAMVDRINAIPNLTEEMKNDQVHRAYDRAQEGIATSKERFNNALDELTVQVETVMREIGGR